MSLDLAKTRTREELSGITYESIIICPTCECHSGNKLVSHVPRKGEPKIAIGGTI